MSVQSAINWIDACLKKVHHQEAQNFLLQARTYESKVAQFERTPQSAPYHAEGPWVQQHIERMLTTVFAVVKNASLLEIEELAARKEWRNQIEGLEQVIREQSATMLAYCVLHDLAKIDVIVLDAPEESKGASIGFRPRRKLDSDKIRQQENELYQKYLQHFSIEQNIQAPQELASRFYDAYEVRVHYPGHAKRGGSAEYKTSHRAIAKWLRLRERDIDLLTWVIRHHMDAISAFEHGPNVEQYELLVGRAQKADLDSHDAMELLAAALFLDACMGSLRYEHGQFSVRFDAIFHFFASEQQVAPYRLARRAQKGQQKSAKAFKRLLEENQLIGQSVFSLFELPHGPERGDLMNEIYAFIRGESSSMSPRYHSEELNFRLKKTKAIFDAQRSS